MDYGIVHDHLPPKTPELNRAEGAIRRLSDMSRAILLELGLGEKFIGEALGYSTKIRLRSPRKMGEKWITPFERLRGHPLLTTLWFIVASVEVLYLILIRDVASSEVLCPILVRGIASGEVLCSKVFMLAREVASSEVLRSKVFLSLLTTSPLHAPFLRRLACR